jgi:predicted Zn-dependent peptidase
MMLRGAGRRSSREIVEALEGAGIQWAQSVSTSHVSFAGAMVARQLPVALPIYADILRRPRLPEDELEFARQMVLQNLAGTEDDPAHRAMSALRQLHYPHPWGMPSEGMSADVERISIDDFTIGPHTAATCEVWTRCHKQCRDDTEPHARCECQPLR